MNEVPLRNEINIIEQTTTNVVGCMPSLKFRHPRGSIDALASENVIFIQVVYKHDLPSGGVNGSTSLSTYFKLNSSEVKLEVLTT